jgi:zinc/manganese transport system ATP-binding protein
VATATDQGTRRRARALSASVVELDGLTQIAGSRQLWQGLSLQVDAGEWVAVLGPNGAGKTTLLRLILGLATPAAGRVLVSGRPAGAARSRIGYVPQQRAFDPDPALRGRDLVSLGLDGHRFGFGASRHGRARIEQAITAVEAAAFADRPVGRLSGGEQQRLRIAQTLVGEPELILADEPLLSLDLAQQRTVVDLLEQRRQEDRTPVIFVTHDINPVLPYVDRVLYLSGGDWATGTVDEVLTSETLSRLYQAPIDVLRVRGRVVVVGTPDTNGHRI